MEKYYIGGHATDNSIKRGMPLIPYDCNMLILIHCGLL